MEKKLFFQNDLKKYALPWSADIYGFMDKKLFSQNDLKKRDLP